MEKTFKVKGMHCASCASIIQKTLKKEAGVSEVEVNYGNESAKIAFDEKKVNPLHLSKKVEHLGYSLVVEEEHLAHEEDHSKHTGVNQNKAEKLKELGEMRIKIISAIPLAVFSFFVMGWDILAEFKIIPEMPEFWYEFFHHLLPLMATYILFVVGKDYLIGLYRFMRYGVANMESLIGLGTVVAYLYSFVISAFETSLAPYLDVTQTYYDVTIVVVSFIALGKYLEMRSKMKTGDAIEKLLNLQAKTALLMRDGAEVEVPVEEVVHGDLLIIKPGSKIPVDGEIVEGESFIDESMVTGEPMPVKKKIGDKLVAGTINTNSVLVMKATKVGSETLLAHIIKMVEEAQGSKPPIQALADKISAVFVPTVLVIATVSLLAWLAVGIPYLGFSKALSFGLVCFVGVLIIACPCALGLATPTAIIVGVGKGAKEGILIKDAATLERLYQVDVIVMDKTGTITRGKPELVEIRVLTPSDSSGGRGEAVSEKEALEILASLEKSSEHPIAHAVMVYAEKHKIEMKKVEQFEILKGEGIKGKIGGVEYFAGNERLMKGLGLELPDAGSISKITKEGKTPIILANKKHILAVVYVADALKEGIADSIKALHRQGIKIVMLTGDDRNTAEHIAKEVGIDEVMAELLPQDKLEKIKNLQKAGDIVAMIGDGVNDAPALAQADVGMAMATGTDVAIESAGITLLNGDVSKAVKAFHLSKATMRTIKQNLFWAFIYNIVGIPIASGLLYPFFGLLLSPIFAGMAMAFSSVSVVSNSLRLKTKKL